MGTNTVMKSTVKKPLLTEKTLSLAAKGWYTFMVDIQAAKATISREIEKLYKVKVQTIRTITMHGKMRRAGRKQAQIKKADWKKALVRLAKGQKIDAFEAAPAQETKK